MNASRTDAEAIRPEKAASIGSEARPASRRIPESVWALALLAPALLLLAALFLYPLSLSVGSAFTERGGDGGTGNFARAFELYGGDIVFSGAVACLTVLIADVLAIAIAGYLTLGRNQTAVAWLRWLYRWPLFIPFVVAAQMMRSFLAKNGLMNNAIVSLGILEPTQTVGFLDWRGVIITFVWKQLPFVTLIVAGAMASLDRSLIEAARNLGAGRLRVLVGIVLPLVRGPLVVASVLTFVTLMSVLSVPMMINAGSPTMITVDMAYRITSLSDYGTANALGVISYLMTAAVAWLYLRQGIRSDRGPS